MIFLNTKQMGVTLFEMLITLSIIAIFSAIAMPSFKQLINQNQQESIINEIVMALSMTRSVAIKHQTNAYLCILNQAQNGCRNKETINNLAYGWLIYSDCNHNKQYDDGIICDTNNDGLSDHQEKITLQMHLSSHFIINLKNNRQIMFRPSGRSSAYGIELLVNHQIKKKINIARTGRIRVETKH